jgi:hypothetical protein
VVPAGSPQFAPGTDKPSEEAFDLSVPDWHQAPPPDKRPPPLPQPPAGPDILPPPRKTEPPAPAQARPPSAASVRFPDLLEWPPAQTSASSR